MGLFEDVFAWMDHQKRLTKRTVFDAYQNPALAAEKYTDRYDDLPWYGQAALSANPITNVPMAGLQMRKYAGTGDLTGMGITAAGALFPPLKMGGLAGRGLLRSLSPTGIVAGTADTAYELPEDRKQYQE